MNGSRSRTAESPTSGQYQQRNCVQYLDDCSLYPQATQQYQIQNYHGSKQPNFTPRMSNVALGQQQAANMYTSSQPNMRNAPQYMTVRPQRYQSPNQPYTWMCMANQQTPCTSQQVLMNQTMMPPRLPNSTYMTNITPTQPTWPGPMQQLPSNYVAHNYGNSPLYYGNNQGQQRSSTPGESNTLPKRKNMIDIVDPNTGKSVNLQTTNVPSEPVSKSTSAAAQHPAAASLHNNIAAQFAAQVAASLTTSKQTQDACPSQPSVINSFHLAPVSDDQTFGHKQYMGPETSENIPPNIPLSIPSSIPQYLPTNQENNFVVGQHDGQISNGVPTIFADIKSAEINVSLEKPVVINSTEPMTEKHNQKDIDISEKHISSVAPEVAIVSVRTDTSDGVLDTCKVVSASNREETPDKHLVSVANIEKGTAVIELAKETPKTEPTQWEVSGTKKERLKKKAKDLNKKGNHLLGSEFDAYTDDKVKEEKQKEVKLPSSDKSKPTQEIVEWPQEKVEPEKLHQTQAAPVASSTPVIKEEIIIKEDIPVAPVVSSIPIIKEEIIIKKDIPVYLQQELSEPICTPVDDDISKVEGVSEDVVEDSLEEGEIVDDNEKEEMELKYKYCEDQWSPLNPEGKKHYDREFLLQFQFDCKATSKPSGLPDIPDIVLDKPNLTGRQYSSQVSSGSTGSQDYDFTPKYIFTPSSGSKSRGVPRQSSNQNKGGNYQQRTINVSIHKDIELHKADKAWKSGRVESKDGVTVELEDAAAEELYKKTRSILNKLTPQKFETLITQLQDLPIDKEYKLNGVIDLVFEKAISEPSFSVAYANMCRCLSMFKVPSDSKPGEVNFRSLLLTRCQREFEKDTNSEALFDTKRTEINKCEEGPKREELKAELDYEETKAKRKSLGNIRFIGELFKLKMLTENIMHHCLTHLLRFKDEEHLECLCRLLTTVGKELDTDKIKLRMDPYFQQMSKIVGEKKTSSRVRFMLQDVIDLRMGKWIPRRTDNNPKTIDQIHKEMEQEAQEKALQAQQAQIQQKSNRGGRRGPQDQRGGGGGGSSDGWNTVGSRTSLKSVDRSIDPSRMKLSKQNVDESIQLGPGGGAGKFSGWGRGSTGGTTGRPSQEKERPNAPTNRFSALSKPEEESGRRYGGSSPARGDSRGHGGYGRQPSLNAKHSQELEREKAISAAKAISSSQSIEGVDRDRERGRGNSANHPQVPSGGQEPHGKVAAVVKVLTANEMDKKTKAILDEYFLVPDITEAVECIKELSEQNHHDFVKNSINHVLERSSQARKHTGHLLHDLVKGGVISVENYITGLVEMLEYAEDMEIDIPMIWQYYGELISPMIQDGSVPLGFLKEAAQPLITNNKAGVLLAEVLHDASHREGHKKVSGLWNASGVQWSDFLPKNQVEQFLVEKGLKFTIGGDSVPTTPAPTLSVQEISNTLSRLIVNETAENDAIFDWIESTVDEATTKQPKFIRALMTAVCASAIKGEKGKETLEAEGIRKHNDLLKKYLDHKAESVLQALYALQALITKLEHPPGLLNSFFDLLYDEAIISENAFFLWEKSDEEPEGKGAAIKQAVRFFTWLHQSVENR